MTVANVFIPFFTSHFSCGIFPVTFQRVMGFIHTFPMKTFTTLITLGAFLSVPILAQAKINRTVEKTFTVQEGGDLKVQTSGGDIEILSGNGSEVKVTARERI